MLKDVCAMYCTSCCRKGKEPAVYPAINHRRLQKFVAAHSILYMEGTALGQAELQRHSPTITLVCLLRLKSPVAE